MQDNKRKEKQMGLLEAIKSRRSIRAFKPDPVPRKVLAEVLDVATRAPSSAPTFVIIVADKSASGWFVFDIGLITQTIALAAQEYELSTCILGDAAAFPEEMRRIANIPESKRVIIGIAIGYPDWNNPINSLRTEREPIKNLITWCETIEEGRKNI